jgi:hypothetical protein
LAAFATVDLLVDGGVFFAGATIDLLVDGDVDGWVFFADDTRVFFGAITTIDLLLDGEVDNLIVSAFSFDVEMLCLVCDCPFKIVADGRVVVLLISCCLTSPTSLKDLLLPEQVFHPG